MSMTRDELRALWDRESRKYLSRGSALSDFPLPAAFLPRAGDTVLDAGCGSGSHMGMYRQVTGKVFGVDFSDAMVRAALRYGPALRGDIQQLPFKSSCFDYVSSHVVINHVLDGRSALAECARVIKPGGRLVVVVPNLLSALAAGRALLMKLGQYSLGFSRHYTVSMLFEEGGRNGLSICQTWTIPKVPTAERRLTRFPSWLGYQIDLVVRRVYRLWGGDLAVLFRKDGCRNQVTREAILTCNRWGG